MDKPLCSLWEHTRVQKLKEACAITETLAIWLMIQASFDFCTLSYSQGLRCCAQNVFLRSMERVPWYTNYLCWQIHRLPTKIKKLPRVETLHIAIINTISQLRPQIAESRAFFITYFSVILIIYVTKLKSALLKRLSNFTLCIACFSFLTSQVLANSRLKCSLGANS